MSSESAKKAWETRRKNLLRKMFKSPSGQLKGIPKVTQEAANKAANEAAMKAWEIRRKDEAERLEAIRILDEMAAKRNDEDKKS